MTPADLDRIAALATAARDALVKSHDANVRWSVLAELRAALTPDLVLDLLAAARPVEAGEFGHLLSKLVEYTVKACTPDSPESYRLNCRVRDELLYRLARTHATLVAERDALRVALQELAGGVPFDWPGRSDDTKLWEINKWVVDKARTALAGAGR